MNLEDFKDIKSLLSEPKNIAIVSHRNPDGDAYGSSLALYHYLLKFNHQVTVVSPNDCPAFLKWLPAQDKIVIFEKDEQKGIKILEAADIIFTLDFNALHRVGIKMQGVLEKVKPIFIMIDHHQQPDDYAKYAYVDPKVCSTCQMVYQFLKKLDHLEFIDINVGTCLYAGILTDTGSFRFPSTTSLTHKIVAHLIDLGVNGATIYNNIHNVNTYDSLQLLGRALKNMRVVNKYHTAYITLSQRDLLDFNFKKGDTEGVVNYALSIKNIIFAAIFIEDKKQKIIKISFRSVGNFSVNDFSRNHFNGGGHINAAGGKSDESLNDAVANFLNILPTYQEDLKQSYEK
ncbi:MAG: bifunctional oligoribonuclease/PAP phosphatase NrnA [Flavobacteriaceae bacterium]|nr:bifunctional oligoribonuclease/PAP phosphatase NrnA [Flavobacteriaceae bacterium]